MKKLFITFCVISLVVLGYQGILLALVNGNRSDDAELMNIRDFVRQTFIHGVPYEEASKYDSGMVPVLLEMLNDPAEEEHWANVAVTLCIIGDERTVDPLIAFIGKDVPGTLSHSHYVAKTSAIMAMGYLINKTGDEKALAYLQDSLKPEMWEERKTTWASPYQASTTDRNLQLSKMAILGLALSGHPAAAEALRSLQKPATTEAGKRFQAQVSDVVSEALRSHEMISKEGLAGYYRKSRF